MIDRITAAIDRWLAPSQYALGKWYKKRGRLPEAVAAFTAAEAWLASKHGDQHPYVVAAVVQRAWCYAKQGKQGDACREYERALRMIGETTMPDHPLADEISEYLATKCT